MVRVIEGLASDWHRLDERIEVLSSEIEELAKRDAGCERLMSVPGIGPIISSAMVAAIGTRDSFSKGRDFAAWLGLVPRQISTGDRTILGKISKRGNRYLRVLFVQAAWVVLVKVKPTRWQGHGLRLWIEAAKKRLHHNVLAIALANKLARIAWTRADIHDGPEPTLQSKAGYIDARPLTLTRRNLLATHGRTIHWGQTRKYSRRVNVFRSTPNCGHRRA